MIDDFDTENEFVSEQVRKLALNAMDQVLGGQNITYSKDKVNSWCSQISDVCIKELAKLNKPFKYVITCIIMQKNGCGLNSATTAYWDAKRDGLVSVQLQTTTFDCIVTIAGMSI